MNMISCHYTLQHGCDSQYYLDNNQNILKTLKVALKHTLITLTIQYMLLGRIFFITSQISYTKSLDFPTHIMDKQMVLTSSPCCTM